MAYAAIRDKVVASALSYVGLTGGTDTGDDQFIQYYNKICGTNFSVSTTPWCAIFVTYNLRMMNVPTWVCPNFAGCGTVIREFLSPTGFAKDPKKYTPKPGDLIFFHWTGSQYPYDHVGLVEKVVGNTVYTIEGNTYGGYSKCGVRHKSYSLTSANIAKYGAIPYESIDSLDNPFPVPTLVKNGSTGTGAYWVQFELKMIQKYSIDLDGAFGPASEAALKKFQAANKLDADGVAGSATIKALQESHKKLITPTPVTPTTPTTPSTGGSTNTSEGSDKDATQEICDATMNTKIKLFQTWLNNKYTSGLKIDGIWGPASRKAAIKAFQTELNKQNKAGLTVDGIWGPKTKAKAEVLYSGAQGQLTMIAQGMLYANGYDVGALDGVFGANMLSAVKRFQTDFRIGTVFNRGSVNANTWEWLFKK